MSTRNPTLHAAIEALWAHMTNNPGRPWVNLDLAEPAKTPMRLLTTVEMATLRVEVDLDTPSDPQTRSIAMEAALRIRGWEAQKAQASKSGGQIARELQLYFWPLSHKARRPLRGLDLLRFIDETSAEHHVTVWLDTLHGDRYCKVRLAEWLASNRLPSATSAS